MSRECCLLAIAGLVLLGCVEQKRPVETLKPLVYEAENCTTPADAWQADKPSENKWNLWSTDTDAQKKWSGGVVLQSPPVKKDRTTPEEGAPPLHTHIAGIPSGRYEVQMKMGRTLAVSRDGKNWERLENGYLGVADITNGAFDLWVDDRYADARNPGSAYYDCLTFLPLPPRVEKPKIEGFAKERVRERLDRGLVAMPTGGGRVYLGWRLLASDPEGVAFNVYRKIGGGAPERLNPAPIRETTDFVDTTAPPNATCEYTVRAVSGDGEGAPSPPIRATASDQAQDCILIKLDEGEKFQKIGIGDLDGDGRLDYVIKQPEDNIDPAGSYWKPSPDTYKVEAYTHDGRRLWRKDLGWAIERGIWYSPMVVYDLDGDGRAEVALKTGEGDPRGPDGRVEKGPEWLSILDGRTGWQRARVDWPSRQIPGEKYSYNYASRNQLCVAYLDGKTPCIIVERGTYTTIRLVAYQFHDNKLKKLWEWDSREEAGRGKYNSQGAHTMHAADVDGDGRDEVIIGSAVVDDNGAGLWTTGLGHPDFIFVGDLDPSRPGLEIFYGIEPGHKENNLCLVDAKTGEIIWGLKERTNHVGSDGVAADIDIRYPGAECHAVDIDARRKFAQSWLFTVRGELLLKNDKRGLSTAAYWDADLQREIVRGGTISDFDGGPHPPQIVGHVIAIADVIGDWREEIITSAPGELRIYTTTIPAMDRRVCLMQDPIYRMDVVQAFQGYYCIPTLSVLPSAGKPGIAVMMPPDGKTPCTAVVAASVDKPVRGTLQLAGEGVSVAPTQVEVEVPAGGVKQVPFTWNDAAPASSALQRALNGPVRREAKICLSLPEAGLRAESSLQLPDRPLTGVPIAQAEDFVKQEGGSVKVRDDKLGASGKAISHWDKAGHRLTWKIKAPEAGRYALVFRYCCPNPAERELLFEGATPAGPLKVAFPATGGFGDKANDWAHAPARAADGKPQTWSLEARDYTITLTNSDGKGLNLDYLALIPLK